MANSTNLSYAAQQVRLYDRHRFVAALFAPSERREALFVLYAFNLEIAKIREVVSEPIMGQIRLQWWRDALAAIEEGRPAPHHLVAEPLAEVIRLHALPIRLLLGMIDAREDDLASLAPEDLSGLEAYAETTAGNLLQLALHVLDADSPAALNAGLHVGAAQALSGLMTAMPRQIGRRRAILPADCLAGVGLSVDDVLAGRGRERLAEVVRMVCSRASARLQMAEEVRPAVPRRAVPALLPALDARRWLTALRRVGFDPFALPPGSGQPPLFRFGLAALTGRW